MLSDEASLVHWWLERTISFDRLGTVFAAWRGCCAAVPVEWHDHDWSWTFMNQWLSWTSIISTYINYHEWIMNGNLNGWSLCHLRGCITIHVGKTSQVTSMSWWLHWNSPRWPVDGSMGIASNSKGPSRGFSSFPHRHSCVQKTSKAMNLRIL